jgi:hypothetical protein
MSPACTATRCAAASISPARSKGLSVPARCLWYSLRQAALARTHGIPSPSVR